MGLQRVLAAGLSPVFFPPRHASSPSSACPSAKEAPSLLWAGCVVQGRSLAMTDWAPRCCFQEGLELAVWPSLLGRACRGPFCVPAVKQGPGWRW